MPIATRDLVPGAPPPLPHLPPLPTNVIRFRWASGVLTVGIRPLFWLLVAALNLAGAADIIIDYYHGNEVGLAAMAGELGAAYAIPIIYVPALMITHVAAFYLLARPQPKAVARLPLRLGSEQQQNLQGPLAAVSDCQTSGSCCPWRSHGCHSAFGQLWSFQSPAESTGSSARSVASSIRLGHIMSRRHDMAGSSITEC